MSQFIKIDDVISDERTVFFQDLIPEDLELDEKCRLIGAVDEEGYPEGVVVFRFTGWITTILYIGVYPELRRRGLGTELIDTLMKYLVPIEYSIMVEAYYMMDEEGDEDAEAADLFFRSLPDFEVVSGGKYCTVTSHTVWNSKRLKLLENFDCTVKSYMELGKAEKNELTRYLKDNNMDIFLQGKDDTLIPELSLCHVENGKCSTVVIFRNSELKRSLELSFLMSRPGEGDSLSGVLNEVIKRIKTMYPHHNLVFSLVNKESELVAKRFFAKDLKVSEIYNAVSFGKIE